MPRGGAGGVGRRVHGAPRVQLGRHQTLADGGRLLRLPRQQEPAAREGEHCAVSPRPGQDV